MKTRNRSVRLTRRSFRRKLVMFGVSIFASLAITATGFAAWVLSTDAMAETDGGIELGSVSEAGVEIKDLTFRQHDGSAPIKDFKFEPAAGDTTGRVRVDKDGTSEDMDIEIGWTVKNYQNVKTSKVEFKIPENVYSAVTKGYLALPAEFVLQTEGSANTPKTEEIDGIKHYVYVLTADGELNGKGDIGDLHYEATKTGNVTDVEFTLTLKFLWGSKFDDDITDNTPGTNPSLYYDTVFDDTTKGVGVPYAEVKKTLIDLKATIYGAKDSDAAAALSKITDPVRKDTIKNPTDILEILGAMTAEEQDAFYATLVAPTYKLVVHAIVN